MAFQRVTWRLRLQHGSFIRWHLWWQRLAVIKTKKERKRKTNIYRIQEQTRNSWSKVRERHDFQALKLDECVRVYQLVLVFRNWWSLFVRECACERVCLTETLPKKVEAFRTILESRWKELVRVCKRSGLVILLPGSEAEERRLFNLLSPQQPITQTLVSQSFAFWVN